MKPFSLLSFEFTFFIERFMFVSLLYVYEGLLKRMILSYHIILFKYKLWHKKVEHIFVKVGQAQLKISSLIENAENKFYY